MSAPLTEFYRQRRFARFSRIGLSYTLSQTSVKDLEVNSTGDTSNFIPVIYSQSKIMTSRLTGTFSYDMRDGTIDPTAGSALSFSMAFAGLGGDVRTYQPVLSYTSSTAVRNKRSNRPHVFAFRLVAGHVASFGRSAKIAEAQTNSLSFINGVPIYERFYLGGEDTIRGYNTRSVTPVSTLDTYVTTRNLSVASNATGTAEAVSGLSPSLVERLTALGTFTGASGSNSIVISRNYTSTGGDTQLLGNFEYRVPLFGPFQLAAFADIGSVFNLHKTEDQTYSSSFIGDDPYLSTSYGLTLNALIAAQSPRLARSSSTGGLIIRDERLTPADEFSNALRVGPLDSLTGLPAGFDQVFVRGDVQTNTKASLSSSLFSGLREKMRQAMSRGDFPGPGTQKDGAGAPRLFR